MAESPKGLSENIEMALSKAHFNVCNSKNPIRTIKDFSTVKYVFQFPPFFFVTIHVPMWSNITMYALFDIIMSKNLFLN